MLAYIQLIRPLNCIMTAVAVFIGGLVVSSGAVFSSLPIYLAMLAAFLVCGGGNAVNDFFDIEADRINKPKRPIPSGKIGRYLVLVFALTLFVLGIVIAGMINFITFFIAAVNSVLLILYSSHLQNKIVIGNVTISYLVASSFLFGGAAMGNVVLSFILMMLSGFANLAREIVKDLEDLEGDRKSFLKRLVDKATVSIGERFGITSRGVRLKRGKHGLLVLATVSLIIAIIISPTPYLMGIFGISYLIVLIPTDLIFLYAAVSIMRAGKRRKFSRISKQIKIGMFLGLLAFIAGALL